MPLIPWGYAGDIRLEETHTFMFNTTDVISAPIAIAGSPTLAAYVNGGATQLTAGLTLAVQDSVVGLYKVTGVFTAANAYAVASNIEIVLEGACTIDGVTATGKKCGSLSIQNRSVATSAAGGVSLANAQGIQKNTALTGFQFPMYTTAGVLATGVTVVEERSINGAAFAACANNSAEIGTTGVYQINLAATDTNGDTLMFKFTATGCVPTLIGPIKTRIA